MAERRSIVYGLHAVTSVLERRSGAVRRAWCLDRPAGAGLRNLRAALVARGIEPAAVSRQALDRIADGGSHQGVAVEVQAPRALGIAEIEALVATLGRETRLLVLDRVEDPRNLGACLRTADAAGVHAVVVPKSGSARLTAAASKAAGGAADTVPVAVVPNLARLLGWLKQAGVWIVGADGRAPAAMHETRLEPPVAIVMGAEGRGLRRLTRESCDELVRIPMYGTVDSLNVSVAAGVLLFELARQAPPRDR